MELSEMVPHFLCFGLQVGTRMHGRQDFDWFSKNRNAVFFKARRFSWVVSEQLNFFDPKVPENFDGSSVVARVLWQPKLCIGSRCIQALYTAKFKSLHFFEKSRAATITQHVYQDPTGGLYPSETMFKLLMAIAIKASEDF